jgi:hypothetical protein
LDPGVEYDLDLCLISHVIDLNAINHVGMSRLYGNSTQQQGNGQQSERAGKISYGSQRATDLQYFSFFPTPQSAHPVKQPPEQSLSGREKSHPDRSHYLFQVLVEWHWSHDCELLCLL